MASIPGAPTFVPSRPARVLSNSAAEFVETRAGSEICRRATGGLVQGSDNEVKFVPQLDRFMPQNEAPEEASYYQASAEMLEKFQETLKSFTQTLQSRSIFKKLGIEACDPAKCDLKYVLKVAALLQEHKEGSENTQTIKKFMRKCVRGAASNKAAITALLSMVPSDVYGSVISGGFSLILAAVENHEKNRAEIQSMLADIPRKLVNIGRLSEVSVKWPTMHHCADQIFLAIFVVLERIIDKLSMTTFQKGVSKIKGRGGDVKEAIEALGDRVKEFKEEAETCSQIMLGRTHDRVQNIQSNLGQVGEELSSKLGEVQQEMQKILTNQQEMPVVIATLFNTLYAMFASDERFNPLDGTFIQQTRAPAGSLPPKRTGSILFSVDKARELADMWLSGLGTFDPMPEAHITECLSGFSRMSPEEMDQAQWVMASDQLGAWLSPAASGILDMHLETAPGELVNALSFSAASLAFSLARATEFSVLSFFCGLRTKGSRDPVESGPEAIRNSLNGQLLQFMVAKRQTADLSFLERDRLMKRSRNKPKYARILFKELLAALPDGDVVFIIIDSFSRLGGTAADMSKGYELLGELAALKSEMPQLVVKVLVTDAMPNCPIRKLADLTLCVPDDVDGWRSGVSSRYLDERKTVMIEQFVRLRKQGSVDGLESDEDGESDSERE